MTTRFPFLKDLTPPLLWRAAATLGGQHTHFRGRYATWAEASAAAAGYENPAVIARVHAAALEVKHGAASYERDGRTFDTPDHPYAVVAGLLLAASLSHGRLHVLDYGGSLGSQYYPCRRWLRHLAEFSWNIVEQEAFVRLGRQDFTDRTLAFFGSADESLAQRRPTAVLLASALQYQPKPYAVLDTLRRAGAPVIVIDRTPFTACDDDVLTVQVVPKSIYPASYPSWIFARARLRAALGADYEVISEFDSGDAEVRGGGAARYGGMILQRRDAP